MRSDPQAVIEARCSTGFAERRLGCRRNQAGWRRSPSGEIIVTTLTIELPDALAEEARERGLLASAKIEAMIRDALRRRAAQELSEAAAKLAAAQVPPMTMAEIQREVDAVRAERQRRAAGA